MAQTQPPPLCELVKLAKSHQEKKVKWESDRELLQNELSVLTAKKVAIDLCRRDLEEQIFGLQGSLGLSADGTYDSNVNDESTLAQNSPLTNESGADASNGADDSFERPSHDINFSYKFKHSLSIHLDAIRSVCFYPSAPMVATASDDGTIRIICIEPKNTTKRKVRRPPQNICSLRGHDCPIICLTSLNSGGDPWMISGAIDGSVVVWQLPRQDVTLYDVHGVITHSQMYAYNHIHSDAVWSIEPLSGSIVVTASADGTLKTWDIFLGTPKEVKTCDRPLLCKVCDESHFIVACHKGKLEYFENLLSKKVANISEQSDIVSLAIAPNDRLAFVGFSSGDIKVVSYPNLNVIKEIKGNNSAILSLCISPCDNFCLAAMADGKSKYISLQDFAEKPIGKDEKENHQTKYGEGTICVGATPAQSSKMYFATGGADGVLHIFLRD